MLMMLAPRLCALPDGIQRRQPAIEPPLDDATSSLACLVHRYSAIAGTRTDIDRRLPALLFQRRWIASE